MAKLDDIATLTTPHHPQDWANVDSVAADTVRVLAADAVQKVGNAHPGTAICLGPLAYTLF
jgi:transketolase